MATTPSRSKAVQAEVFVQIQPVFDECLAGALRLDSQAVHLSVVLEVVLKELLAGRIELPPFPFLRSVHA
ncbi:TPA: hypothetical protein NH099_000109 [Pseudomonas aeruginosa]|uniref:hypothetical protein n=1 Tax=Pseudomonadales TaxID=72274 RepID=UPI001572ED85|nr:MULTISPECIES: hypothetical protein [Pseudomonas]MBI8029073.1 hypothetical protein [Pseudomonas aeruginosa]MCU9194720.1 hypothetical protein [Pseudomonas aeruginosa]NTU01947.1 hypothetical protein [Pseudomonas aeruginosa]NTU08176.1 hypothetical protein [Pseudomonas aeruginosa]UZX34631.1 hypothetical protein M6E97_19180 [Pseudomonas sp. B111]